MTLDNRAHLRRRRHPQLSQSTLHRRHTRNGNRRRSGWLRRTALYAELAPGSSYAD